jgi:hypothetical protein
MRGHIAGLAIPTAGLLLWACAARPPVQFEVWGVATDKSYGYSYHNPIKVGGFAEGRGTAHRNHFLELIRGPEGQALSYISNGFCCAFRTDSNAEPVGYLEVVLVSYKGIGKPAILYFDTVNFEGPKAPVGFTVAPP